EEVEKPEGRGGEQREVAEPAVLARRDDRAPAAPQDDEPHPPPEVQEERVTRGAGQNLRPEVDRLVAHEEADVLHQPGADVGRELRVEEEPERDPDRRVDGDAPLCAPLDPQRVYEEEEAEPEKRLEGGVAEGVQEGDDGQQRRPTAAGERDRDEDEEE